jgi:predicted  nucleic acid-binding Zn-ribbon protein
MGKRKTHDEYVAELAVKNPGVTVVGEYVDAKTKIDHLCGCGEIWKTVPSRVLRGALCKKCGTQKTTSARTKPKKEYVKELAIKNPDVVLVGNYLGMTTKTLHLCGRCGKPWIVKPNHLLSGNSQGCRSCSGIEKKSHAKYVAELASLEKGIEAAEEYQGSQKKITHRCAKGHEWGATPTCILRGTGCPKCSETASDANVFYLWANDDDPGVFKIGITSERRDADRIIECTRKTNLTPRIIMMLKTPNARDIERRALELGDDPRYPDTIDGYTEFRRYSDAELGEVWRMAVGA